MFKCILKFIISENSGWCPLQFILASIDCRDKETSRSTTQHDPNAKWICIFLKHQLLKVLYNTCKMYIFSHTLLAEASMQGADRLISSWYSTSKLLDNISLLSNHMFRVFQMVIISGVQWLNMELWIRKAMVLTPATFCQNDDCPCRCNAEKWTWEVYMGILIIPLFLRILFNIQSVITNINSNWSRTPTEFGWNITLTKRCLFSLTNRLRKEPEHLSASQRCLCFQEHGVKKKRIQSVFSLSFLCAFQR